MRLKAVEIVDFRLSEWTNFVEWQKTNPEIELGKDDVVCFLSLQKTQVVFVSALIRGETDQGKECTLLPSRRLRIQGGGWSPFMIKNYADEVGIELQGLKRLEDHYAHLDEHMDAARHATDERMKRAAKEREKREREQKKNGK